MYEKNDLEQRKIQDLIDNFFSEISQKFNLENGDVSPEDLITFENIVNNFIDNNKK
jgi:hypothetical protein